MVFEWDIKGWHTTGKDGYKLKYGFSIMVASHADKQVRCLIVILGPISIAMPWFNKRGEK